MTQAVVFDAYGTLFDVYSVAQRCDEFFPGQGAALSRLWRAKQLEYTWLQSLMGRYQPFDVVTLAALRYACASLGLDLGTSKAATLMEQYLRLSAFADVDAALRSLAGRKLAILSNGSPSMLHGLMESSALRTHFAAVMSVDVLRIYKPHPSVYQLAVDQLHVAAADVAFISSNYWDAAGATAFGFRTFWINRAHVQSDELGVQPWAVLSSLAELPGRLAAIS